ncbi:MAG: cobalamin-dependent protein [Candidatus Ozemobacteraceae bacterium]
MQKQTIILIHPPTSCNSSLGASTAGAEHLGLGLIATYLEGSGFNALVKNFEANWTTPAVAAEAVANTPNVLWVGISPTSLSISWVIQFADSLKMLEETPIGCGGHLASLMGSEFLREVPSVDFVVVGPGELPARKISESIASGDWPQGNIPGVLCRNVSKAAPDCTSSEYKFLCWPKRNRDEVGSSARILTSFGCKMNCSFCTTPSISGGRRILRELGDVLAEMRHLVSSFNVRTFYINDDAFLTCSDSDISRADELFRSVADLGVGIRILSRSDAIVKCSDRLRKWHIQGLFSVFLGVESAIEQTLNFMNKCSGPKMHEDAIRVLSECEIFPVIGFMMFTPETSIQDLRVNLEFLARNRQLYRCTPICRTMLGFPGTNFTRRLRESASFDVLRSSPFLYYPAFQHEEIRVLSKAMEEVEIGGASFDRHILKRVEAAYLKNPVFPALASDAIAEISRNLMSTFENSIEMACRGCHAHEIVESFTRLRRPTFEKYQKTSSQ